MRPVRIFTEGKDDSKFIEDYLKFIGRDFAGITLTWTGGWTNLHQVSQLFQTNTQLGGVNLIIFDADDNYLERRGAISGRIAALNLTTELFLFPNNQDSGNFDSLLASISNPAHNGIFTCFDAYVNCIVALNPNYTRPLPKDRNFAYLQTLGAEAQGAKRNYLIADHWHLNHPILNNLKVFLDTHILP